MTETPRTAALPLPHEPGGRHNPTYITECETCGTALRITNNYSPMGDFLDQSSEPLAAQDAARQRDEIRLPIRRCGHCNSWLGVAKEHECHREDTVIDAILSEYALLRATEGKQQ